MLGQDERLIDLPSEDEAAPHVQVEISLSRVSYTVNEGTDRELVVLDDVSVRDSPNFQSA